MSQVFKLYRLQQFDSQIDQLKQQQKSVEDELKDIRQINETKTKLDQTMQELQNQQKEIKKIEDQGKSIQIKLEQNQASLYGGRITNPKELQDLQQEAGALRKQFASVENEQLDLMIEADETQQIVNQYQNLLTQLETEFELRKNVLEIELVGLLEQQNRLQQERNTIASTTPAEDLKQYESIRIKRSGIAVAKISDFACSACGSTLSASQVHHAKSPTVIAFCDTCGRILYSG